MDPHTIANVLRDVGADKVRVTRSGKISCCCVLARWTHPYGRDGTPSMVVYPDGDKGPTYGCMSCHDTGTLIDLLLFLRTRGRHDVVPWLHVLEGQRLAESVPKSERLKGKAEAASIFGSARPAVTSPRVATIHKTFKDGRAFFDYKLLAEAEGIEAIQEDVYAPYAGSVPRYALERGLTMDTCKAFGLGHDPEMKRLLFPIRDRGGRLVAISGRLYATSCLRCGGEWARRCRRCARLENEHEDVDDGHVVCADGEPWEAQRPECVECELPEPPKYLHSTGFKRNFVLYGEHMKAGAEDERVYVVEGHMDMLRMWQAGYRSVVAVLGSHPGQAQIEKLIKYWKKVIVVGDGNKAGREMAARVKKMVADRIPVTVRDLDEGRDPGNMTPVELAEKLGSSPALT